ncbi:MAG: phosphotransferase family protein [Anaerolineae bacterium]
MTTIDELMSYALDPKRIREVVQHIDPTFTVVGVSYLAGGVSANMISVEVSTNAGNNRKFLLRWHGDIAHDDYPSIVEREYQLLKHLNQQGLTVPKPILLDKSGEILATTFLVLQFIPGETSFSLPVRDDYLQQAAETLARIHRLEPHNSIVLLLPSQIEICSRKLAERPDHLDASLSEATIRHVLEAAWPWKTVNKDCLLHGDFWPGNWLWDKHQLIAIIDWEDAKLGDPLADLAISRLEILWAFGQSAMETFTRIYLRNQPSLNLELLPYWDLFSALRPMNQLDAWAPGWAAFGRNDVTVDTMRQAHSWFISQAFDMLSSRD